MIGKPGYLEEAEEIFAGWQETLIWSCLQGVMGEVYTEQAHGFKSGMALLGDFCFLAGKPNEELVRYRPKECRQEFVIMVPRDEAWGEMIERCYEERAKKVTRYAFRKEPEVFCEEKLKQITAALPPEYSIRLIDEELYHWCREGRQNREREWCADWVSQYADYEMYRRYGLGVVAVEDGEPVSGASSYSSYRGGIEIEIDTRPDYRRRGLARICGAGLILECLKRGLYPSWDAQNLWSKELAGKLGYHFDHSYTAYEIWGWNQA